LNVCAEALTFSPAIISYAAGKNAGSMCRESSFDCHPEPVEGLSLIHSLMPHALIAKCIHPNTASIPTPAISPPAFTVLWF